MSSPRYLLAFAFSDVPFVAVQVECFPFDSVGRRCADRSSRCRDWWAQDRRDLTAHWVNHSKGSTMACRSRNTDSVWTGPLCRSGICWNTICCRWNSISICKCIWNSPAVNRWTSYAKLIAFVEQLIANGTWEAVNMKYKMSCTHD